jgi:hypothetical protein
MRESAAEDPRMRDLAAKLIWWKSPDETLADERRFLAQAMTFGNWEEAEFVRSVYGDDALRAVLADAPPGVFDQRSWNYWHLIFGQSAVPPLPRRRL